MVTFVPPSYAHEKLLAALESLATGPGDVRERLLAAYQTFHPLKQSHFPPDLRKDFEWVLRQLTKREPISRAQAHQLRAKGFSVLVDLYPANIYGPQNALVVTATYLQQRPDVVEKVVTALVEAMAFSLAPTNKPTVLRAIMKLFNLTDLAAAERGYENLADLNRKPYPSVERLRNLQRVIALHDPKVLNLRVEELIEDRFVRKLDESGIIDQLYRTYGVK